MDALVGKEGAKGRVNLIQQSNGNDGIMSPLGFRAGKWKLQREMPRLTTKQRNDKNRARFTLADASYKLYDLSADPAESKNMAQQHPEVLERMKAELEQQLMAGRTRH